MANSAALTGGVTGHIDQYNNLRKDVLDIASGHRHSGAVDGGASLFTASTPLVGAAFDTPYQATHDCFICLNCTGTGVIQAVTDAVNPPTVLLMSNTVWGAGGLIFPVKKGEWWMIVKASGTPSLNFANVVKIGA